MTNTDRHGDGSGVTSTNPAFAVGALVANRYRVVRLIGSGGAGEVYAVVDQALGGAVALKTLRPSGGTHAVELERFRREIQNARKITHPNVCRIFDLGTHREGQHERVFLTMELLEGQTLAERLERGRAYSPDEALPIAEQLADALFAAHKAGVVHRDLKPANIMLLSSGASGPAVRAVITDFGIALSTDQGDMRLTDSGELIGTPEYMAPEQADVGPALPGTDIYGLGLILFEMLSKRRPFDSAATAIETMLLRRRHPARSLREVVPDVPPAWSQTIARCLERDPKRRFARALDVVASLKSNGP